jgi:KaiC/GvpD/RAD55 family RecA-like ATPase
LYDPTNGKCNIFDVLFAIHGTRRVLIIDKMESWLFCLVSFSESLRKFFYRFFANLYNWEVMVRTYIKHLCF